MELLAFPGYYGMVFDEPRDVDCGVLEKDFDQAREIIENLGYKKILKTRRGLPELLGQFQSSRASDPFGSAQRDPSETRCRGSGCGQRLDPLRDG